MAEEKTTYTAEEVEQIKANLKAEHDSEMAQQRTKYADEKKKAIDKAVADANLTAEERAKKALEEQNAAERAELEELRTYKKSNELSKRIAKEGLPEHYVYDTRLINAYGDDKAFGEVLKTIKTEFASTNPKGATTSTVIQNSSNSHEAGQGKYAGFDKMLREQLGAK